jgi:DNA-binding NarL/FixJ family response regulator
MRDRKGLGFGKWRGYGFEIAMMERARGSYLLGTRSGSKTKKTWRVETLSTATRRVPVSLRTGQKKEFLRAGREAILPEGESGVRLKARAGSKERARVYIASESRLMREALARMLMKQSDIEVVGLNSSGPFRVEEMIEERTDILLLTSRGSLTIDVQVIRQVRLMAPTVKILIVGITQDETDFFQYVRAGIRGYLPRDASSEDVVEAMHAVHQGKAVCPGLLCALLFQFFEREATSVHSPKGQPRLGLTRREQQIVPLIAQGLTNKEIANQFCLSEQTVKNHLYRMKHKVAAEDRFDIVHLCRTQGFLV